MHQSFQWEIGVVQLNAPDEDDFGTVGVDAIGEEDAGVAPLEQHAQYGFWSRALDPDADGTGCQVLYAYEGDKGHAWLSVDPRVIPLLPAIAPGEALLYGPKGNFVRCFADGRIALFTSDDGTVDGQSVFASVEPDNFTWFAPWGKATFDAKGYHVRCHTGARLDLGGIGGIPGLDAIGSYANLSAGMVGIEGSVITLGSPLAPQDPIARSTLLVTALSAVSNALVGLNAALLTAVPTSGITAANITAAATQVTAAVAALAAAVVGVPSNTVTAS